MQTVRNETIIADWAHRNGFAYFHYARDSEAPSSITVVMNRATARFRDGRLENVHYRNEGADTDELTTEMALLFALCGFIELQDEYGFGNRAPATVPARSPDDLSRDDYPGISS